MKVVLCGCFDDENGEVVALVPENVAEYYMVYTHDDNETEWLADFADKYLALSFAEAFSKAQALEFENRTYSPSQEMMQ